MDAPQKIRIAISGGGLAGATLVNALIKQPHLSVHIYESAAEFSEIGAAVSIASHAQAALTELGLLEVLKNAGAVEMNSTKCVIVSSCTSSHISLISHVFKLMIGT